MKKIPRKISNDVDNVIPLFFFNLGVKYKHSFFYPKNKWIEYAFLDWYDHVN